MSASRPAHNQHAACVRRDMHDECVATCTQVRKSVQNHFLAGGGVINLLSFGTSAISKSELGEGDSSRCDSGRPVARHSAAEALLVCFFLSLWRLRRSCWPFRRLSAANMALASGGASVEPAADPAGGTTNPAVPLILSRGGDCCRE
jgi:hypothetical protein